MAIKLFNHFLLKNGESEVNMDSFLSVDGLDYLFSGLGGLFGDYSYGYYDDYGYNDYSYYDDYDLSLSVGGLGGLFGGLFDDLSYLLGDHGYGYYDDYSYNDYSYDDYDISGNIDDVIQAGADIMNGLDDEIDVDGLISGLLGGDSDLSGLSDLLAGLLGGDTALSVDGELGDLSGLSDILAGLLGGDTTLSVDGELGDISGLSDILAGLLGGDTALSVDGELGDLSGLSDILAGLLGGDTTLSVDGELGDLSGLSDLLAGLLGGDTTLSVDGELGDISGLSDILAGLLGSDTSLSVNGELGDLSGLSDILAGLLGGDTTLSVDGTSDLLSGLLGGNGLDLSSLLSGLLGSDTTLSVDGTSDLLSGLLGGNGLDLSSLLSGLLGGGTTLSVDGTSDLLSGLSGLSGLGNLFGGLTGILGGIGSGDLDGFELLDSLTNLYNGAGISVDGSTASTGSADLLSGLLGGNGLSSLLSGLLGGSTLTMDGTTASSSGLDLSALSGLLGGLTGGTTSTSGLDLSALSGLLGGLTGGTTSTSGLDLSSLLSGLLGGTTLSVDGSTASSGSTNILSALGNLGNLGTLFSGYASILGGIGNGDLDGFELLDSLTNLYNGAGISVDGSTASTSSTDLLSGLSGLLGGNGLSSLLGGLLGGGTSSSGLDLSALSSLLGGLTGGTASNVSVSDTTASNSAYNIIGLVNLISEEAALNGGQDVSSSTGAIIQISDDTWNMMRTTSVLNSILPGEDIYVNADGTQGIVLSTDTDSLQDALKPYNDYLTVSDLSGGLSITINDLDGMQKAVASAGDAIPVVADVISEDAPAVRSIELAKIAADDDSASGPAVLDPIGVAFADDLPFEEFLPFLTAHEEVFQVELDSLREVGFWLDDASMDMGAQNWDGWDIRAIGDFQGDGVDDLLLSHSQTGIMVLLGDSDLSKWDSLDQFVTDDPIGAGAIPADAAGLCMVGDAAQWLESGGASANWIILA